jgi:hypothetical protein
MQVDHKQLTEILQNFPTNQIWNYPVECNHQAINVLMPLTKGGKLPDDEIFIFVMSNEIAHEIFVLSLYSGAIDKPHPLLKYAVADSTDTSLMGTMCGHPVYAVDSSLFAGAKDAIAGIHFKMVDGSLALESAKAIWVRPFYTEEDLENITLSGRLREKVEIPAEEEFVELRIPEYDLDDEDPIASTDKPKYPIIFNDPFDGIDLRPAMEACLGSLQHIEWKDGTDSRLFVHLREDKFDQKILDAFENLRFLNEAFVDLYDNDGDIYRTVNFFGVKYVSQTFKYVPGKAPATRVFTFSYSTKEEFDKSR